MSFSGLHRQYTDLFIIFWEDISFLPLQVYISIWLAILWLFKILFIFNSLSRFRSASDLLSLSTILSSTFVTSGIVLISWPLPAWFILSFLSGFVPGWFWSFCSLELNWLLVPLLLPTPVFSEGGYSYLECTGQWSLRHQVLTPQSQKMHSHTSLISPDRCPRQLYTMLLRRLVHCWAAVWAFLLTPGDFVCISHISNFFDQATTLVESNIGRPFMSSCSSCLYSTLLETGVKVKVTSYLDHSITINLHQKIVVAYTTNC